MRAIVRHHQQRMQLGNSRVPLFATHYITAITIAEHYDYQEAGKTVRVAYSTIKGMVSAQYPPTFGKYVEHGLVLQQ